MAGSRLTLEAREEGRIASFRYFKYEDMVIGNLEALEAFLGFPQRGTHAQQVRFFLHAAEGKTNQR